MTFLTMNKILLASFSLLALAILGVGVMQGTQPSPTQEASQQPISISIDGLINNVIGRDINNAKVLISLPLYAKPFEQADSRFLSSSGGARFYELDIETISFTEPYLLSLEEKVLLSDASEASEHQLHYVSDESGIELPDTQKLPEFLAKQSAISYLVAAAERIQTESPVRIVTGIYLESGVKQEPVCQLQRFNNSKWHSVSTINKEFLPLNVISPQDEYLEDICQQALIDTWGLSVSNLTVTLAL